jgi:hypothetical protein
MDREYIIPEQTRIGHGAFKGSNSERSLDSIVTVGF